MAIDHSPLEGAIKAHWSSLQNQSVEIPELDNQVVFFDPLCMAERDLLARFAGAEMLVEVVIRKSKAADGEKLFGVADKPTLLNSAGGWVARLAERILLADSAPASMLDNAQSKDGAE